jgi:2-amino-4-hydroxy-6-hydroxymethyldihydropteridine diphosphokinase
MIAYLCLGANLGDPQDQISKAVEAIAGSEGITVLRSSRMELTEPYGEKDQPWFWNQVLEVETALEPQTLLDRLLGIEKKLGRVRGERWAPRLIDIDILLYGDYVLKTSPLILPHPDFHNRSFALRLLCELAPNAIHPLLAKTYGQLLKELESREES